MWIEQLGFDILSEEIKIGKKSNHSSRRKIC